MEKITNSTILKVVVYGGTTMAGHIIAEHLPNIGNYKIITINESEIFNDNNSFNTGKYVIKANVDVAINCIRCLVEECEQNISKANLYNNHFPKYLEQYYNDKKTKVIHLSTDCVFSGTKGNYSEGQKPDGNSVYAKTKALGEINNQKDVTIRTSYIGPNIGDSSEELFHWFIMQKNKSVSGYTKAFWNGLTTLELTKGIDKIIKMNIGGIYHLAPTTNLSKYQLLKLIKTTWKKEDISLHKDSSVSYNRTLVDSRKLIEINTYENMLIELFNFMSSRKQIYKQYFQNN